MCRLLQTSPIGRQLKFWYNLPDVNAVDGACIRGGQAVEGVAVVPEHSLHLPAHPPGLVALLAATVRYPHLLVAAARGQGVRVRVVPGQALHLLLVVPALYPTCQQVKMTNKQEGQFILTHYKERKLWRI